jgi:hypothetical protein
LFECITVIASTRSAIYLLRPLHDCITRPPVWATGGKTLYVADTTDLPAGLTFTVGPVTFNDHRVSLALTTTSITISREDTLSELLCVAALSAFVFVCFFFASCVCISSRSVHTASEGSVALLLYLADAYARARMSRRSPTVYELCSPLFISWLFSCSSLSVTLHVTVLFTHSLSHCMHRYTSSYRGALEAFTPHQSKSLAPHGVLVSNEVHDLELHWASGELDHGHDSVTHLAHGSTS